MREMNRGVLCFRLLAVGAVFALASGQNPTAAQAQERTELVSVISAGAAGNYASYRCAISGDGRYVAIESSVVRNGQINIYVYNRQTQTTEMVSVSSGGVEGNGSSLHPAISADGRYVAFDSEASNLISGDTNGVADCFVHNRQTHTTVRVSLSSLGVPGNDSSYVPVLSADGRYVAFGSNATNLVPGDTNARGDIFVRDRQTGNIERVSISSSGVQSNGFSGGDDQIAISTDGQFVAFVTGANNLVPNDSNGTRDVFVHNRANHITERVNVSSAGVEANNDSSRVSISADGRYVAFNSLADNLVPGDINNVTDVFVHDRTTHATEMVSVNSQGEQASGPWGSALRTYSLSSDGRYVAFESIDNNLVPEDTNNAGDIFVRDRINHTTRRVSLASDGTQAIKSCLGYALSTDGQYVVFRSDATNLVSGVTKGTFQIYVRGPLIPLTATVSGTITLNGIVPNATPQPLSLTFHPADNSGDLSRSTSVGPDGSLSVSEIPRKSYTLHIKGSKWLAKNVAVDASNGDVTGVTALLFAGDANNDNFADIADLLVLINAYNRSAPDSHYSEAADFNCDGNNDIADLLLLIGNYNRQGDS